MYVSWLGEARRTGVNIGGESTQQQVRMPTSESQADFTVILTLLLLLLIIIRAYSWCKRNSSAGLNTG